MAESAAKIAVKMIRNSDKRPSKIRYAARKFRISVSDIHAAAGCVNGSNCTGEGCRL
jgi:hypothetical protein